MNKRFRLRNQVKRFSSLSFWQSRSRWQKAKFEYNKRLFNAREFMYDRRGDVSIFQVLVRSTIFSFLFSLLFLVILLQLPIREIQDNYNGSYDNFLIAVASITGIFLSLYFTGLNTVIGGLYAKSPKPVRELIIQERVNHFSVRFLVFLTLLCLELLAIGILFDNRPVSSVVAIAIFGCFAVLFFAELGKRAFYFFDPSLFANQLQYEIVKWAVSSTPKGFEFNTPSFQDNYRRRAENAVSGFQGLIDLAKTETHLKETLDEIANEIQKTYIRYLWVKNSIPTKSRWFLYSPKFRDWYTASEHLVRIANITQTDLQPQNEPDHEWLEEKLENLEIMILSYAIEKHQWEIAQVVLGKIFRQFTVLGDTGEIERAFILLRKIQEVVEKLLVEPIAKPSSWQGEEIRLKIGSIQVLDSSLITLTASLFNSLEKFNLDELKKSISKQNWSKPSSPYDFDLPFRLLERMEYIFDGISFERDAEGNRVTPSWYISELVFQEFAFYLKEISEKILGDGINFLDRVLKSYEDQERFVECTIVASDAQEMESKSRHLLLVAKKISEQLEEEQSIKNLPWAEWNWDIYEERLNSFHERMVVAQVSHLGMLFTRNKPSDFPDYFGKGVVLAGEECLKSLRANNPDYFTKLFPKYFGGILMTFEKFRLNSQNLRPEQFLLLLAEPIMDLLDVSGYSLIYSEYHQNQALWEPCKIAWTNLVKDHGKEYLERLAILIKNKKQSFGMTNRDISRSQWEIDFNSSMRLLPRKYEKVKGIVAPIGLSIVDHLSELIREIGGTSDHFSSFHNADEIFIDIFLSALSEADGLDFGIRHKISESISRKKKRRKKGQ